MLRFSALRSKAATLKPCPAKARASPRPAESSPTTPISHWPGKPAFVMYKYSAKARTRAGENAPNQTRCFAGQMKPRGPVFRQKFPLYGDSGQAHLRESYSQLF